ncbi:MAG: flavodoxin domain-containing protein [Minwuia sp.]|uniref:flavodoxin domain-containing protein n=1 Tax=Minwuia sp. TaxID=2493630 RepID=UPI003A8B5C0E
MSEPIAILVGTMTGTAEMVAEDMQAAIEEADGRDVEIRLMDDLDETAFDDRDMVYLIVTSTYGQGEVPDNALDFLESLQDNRPDLNGIRFGLFGLGDATYADTFNHGGQHFEKIMKELGARQIGERHAHDASSAEMPEERGVEWVKDWLKLLEADEQSA